ncbi:MAG: hypothetical protein ABIP93_08790 [Gemmatimonadaceae bacterium]
MIAFAITACARDSARDAAPDARRESASVAPAGQLAVDTSHRARPVYVVDSVRPVADELRRFRTGLGPAQKSLSGGARSRDALVRRFLDAVSASDTAALRAMVLSRAEFAYLVYPSSPYTHPPYRQPPELVWMQLQSSNASGLRRVLERARGWSYLSHRCASSAREGRNFLWRQCRTRVLRAPGDTADVQLFGVVVERDGRFKLASLESDF